MLVNLPTQNQTRNPRQISDQGPLSVQRPSSRPNSDGVRTIDDFMDKAKESNSVRQIDKALKQMKRWLNVGRRVTIEWVYRHVGSTNSLEMQDDRNSLPRDSNIALLVEVSEKVWYGLLAFRFSWSVPCVKHAFSSLSLGHVLCRKEAEQSNFT